MLSRLAPLGWLAFAACGTAPAPAAPPAPAAEVPAAAAAADDDAELACTLVLLRTGTPPQPLTDDARRAAFQGHFTNMQRLAEAGDLLLAGPFGKQRAPDLRGLFVLDTADPARARALAASDPAVAAGIFVAELHPLRTRCDLREQLRRDLAAQAAIVASGRTPAPGEGGRGYVLLTAANGAAAEAAFAGHERTLCFAWLDEGRALVFLDAKDCAEAQALLADVAPSVGEHRLDDWYGSGLLVDVNRR